MHAIVFAVQATAARFFDGGRRLHGPPGPPVHRHVHQRPLWPLAFSAWLIFRSIAELSAPFDVVRNCEIIKSCGDFSPLLCAVNWQCDGPGDCRRLSHDHASALALTNQPQISHCVISQLVIPVHAQSDTIQCMQLIARFCLRSNEDGSERILAAAFSSSGRFFAASDDFKQLVIWRIGDDGQWTLLSTR
jgi:hypothetical protein